MHQPLRRPSTLTPRLVRLGGAAAAVIVAACAQSESPDPAQATTTGWQDASAHQISTVVVPGASLDLLDWGGTGPVLVLIHGLGDSPHVFDDLAPLLVPDFRVLAYARRGHASSSMAGPFDNGTLTNDLAALLDSLGIQRVSLLGWSMGGNEITEFAIRYPERTAGLVYLDAAYDWADPALVRAFEALPVSITPTAADMPSLDAIRNWFQVTWLPGLAWPAAWEAHLRDLVVLQPDGSVRYRQSDSVNALMFESLVGYRKDYRRVAAPALALYAPDFLPPPVDDPARAAAVAGWEKDLFAPYREASIARFREEVSLGRDTLLAGTSHASIGVVDVAGVAGLVRRFLLAAGG